MILALAANYEFSNEINANVSCIGNNTCNLAVSGEPLFFRIRKKELGNPEGSNHFLENLRKCLPCRDYTPSPFVVKIIKGEDIVRSMQRCIELARNVPTM